MVNKYYLNTYLRVDPLILGSTHMEIYLFQWKIIVRKDQFRKQAVNLFFVGIRHFQAHCLWAYNMAHLWCSSFLELACTCLAGWVDWMKSESDPFPQLIDWIFTEQKYLYCQIYQKWKWISIVLHSNDSARQTRACPRTISKLIRQLL